MTERLLSRRYFLGGAAAAGFGMPALTWLAPSSSWAGSASAAPWHRTMNAMGTLVNISIFGERDEKAREATRDAFVEIRLIDSLMSTHRRYSLLSRINRRAGSESLRADFRLVEVLAASIEWSRRTGGLFDVTTLGLLRAWGFREGDQPPGASGTARSESVREALAGVDWRSVSIEGESVGLRTARSAVDLGGIAKGYAVDRAIAVLRDKWGIRRAIVEAGGDLYALGSPPDAAGWKIALAHPTRPGRSIATFELADRAVATSGNYATRIESEGESRTDIFDPHTGEPAAGWSSLTTLAATAIDADAASTTLFSAGTSAGIVGSPEHSFALQSSNLRSLGVETFGLRPASGDELTPVISPGFPSVQWT